MPLRVLILALTLVTLTKCQQPPATAHIFDDIFEQPGTENDPLMDILWDGLPTAITRAPFYYTPSTLCQPPETLPCPKSFPVRCIRKEFFCDGDPDCLNGEDEANCPNPTTPKPCDERTHRRCNDVLANARCLPIALWCDGDEDCFNGEDEANCSTTAASPTNETASISLSSDFSVEINDKNPTAIRGSDITLVCTVTSLAFTQAEWIHIEHNQHLLAVNDELFADASHFSVSMPSAPATKPSPVSKLSYSLTIKNLSFDDAGVYACRAYESLKGRNSSIIQHTVVYMPGAPVNQHRRIDFEDSPAKQIYRPRNNEACCRGLNVTSNCIETLCKSSQLDSWALEPLSSCMRHLGSGFMCLSGGRYSLPCCVQNGISDRCLELCKKQTSLTGTEYLHLALDCLPERSKLVSCFSETNQLAVDPPLGVSARALNESAIEISWLPPLSHFPKNNDLRYVVYYAQVDASDLDPADNNFRRLTATSEHSFTISKDLLPLKRYAVYVVSLSAGGIVSDRSAIVEAVTLPSSKALVDDKDDEQIATCCANHKVRKDCSSLFCSLNQTADYLQSIVDHGLNCNSDMSKIFPCLAGSYNHTECCQLRHVPKTCLKFCVGNGNNSRPPVFGSSDYACLPYIAMMASCFAENRVKLPNPPQALSVSININTPYRASTSLFQLLPSISATVSWQPPMPIRGAPVTNRLSTDIRRYRLTLTSPGAGAYVQEFFVPASLTRYTFMQPMAHIRYDEMYIVRIAAENGFGMSLDVAVAFSTPDSASAQAGETSVNPALTSSMRACCAATGVSSTCMAACIPATLRNFDFTRPNAFNTQWSCTQTYWRNYAYCASMQTDMTACCQRNNVILACRQICNNTERLNFDDFKSTTAENRVCKLYTSELFACSRQQWSLTAAPNSTYWKPQPPTDLAVTAQSLLGDRVTISWKAPVNGIAFTDYIAAFRHNDSSTETESIVSARYNVLNLDQLVPNNSYWFRMFSVTHNGLRSDPSKTIQFRTNPAFLSSSSAPVTSLESCCAQTSTNCQALCTNLTELHDPGDSTTLTRCPNDVVPFIRCSILALNAAAVSLNKPTADLRQCCQQKGVTATLSGTCCSSNFTLADLQSERSPCNNATVLQSVRECVWASVGDLGVSPVRQLTVSDVTATRAKLQWLPPMFNSEKVSNYKIRCLTFVKNDSQAWNSADYYESDLETVKESMQQWGPVFEDKTPGKVPSYSFGEGNLLRPAAFIRCSVGIYGQPEVAEQTVEFETKPENYHITLEVANEDFTRVGAVVTMDCNTNEIIYSNITWYYASFGNQTERLVSPGLANVNATTLRIASLAAEQAGTYSCEVFSKFANVSFRASAPIFARTAPKAINSPTKIECSSEVSCPTTACSFTGFPDSVSWIRISNLTNGSQAYANFGQLFRQGQMTIAEVPLWSIIHSGPNFTLRATATNFLGSDYCDIEVNKSAQLRDGWKHTPSLCQLIDEESCCSMLDSTCPSLCTLTRQCVDFIPAACVSSFQKCAKDKTANPQLKLPDLSNTFNLTTNAVQSIAKDFVKTQLSVNWLDGKKPTYPHDVDYYMKIDSIYDPREHRLVAIGTTVELPVPNAEYHLTFFAENEIGERSEHQVTQTITSIKPQLPLPMLFVQRLPVTELRAEAGMQIVWFWPYCQAFVPEMRCSQGYVFYRPAHRLKDGTIEPLDKFTASAMRGQLHHVMDHYPEKDYIFMVCVGETVDDCLFSEVVYVKALTEDEVAQAKAQAQQQLQQDAKQQPTNSLVIGLSIVIVLVVLIFCAIFACLWGRRVLAAISARLRTRFVMYQPAATGNENDMGAIIFDDVNNNDI